MHTQFRVSDDHKLRLMLKKQSAKVRVVGRELTCQCAHVGITPASDFGNICLQSSAAVLYVIITVFFV
jgi:hypothetical protein